MALSNAQLHELLLQSLQTEQGGVKIYEAAVECAVNNDLREEWEKYLTQTRRHEEIMVDLCDTAGLDPAKQSPGRDAVRHIGESLMAAIRKAQNAGDPAAAQIVACECVTLAETKDHLNWELLEESRKSCDGRTQEGWTRELWLESLGLPAVLPPPEEKKHVTTAIGAARAKQQREEMI